MSDRFDDIFSLNRLRQNWKSGQQEKNKEHSLPDPVYASAVRTYDAISAFKLLKELLEKKYQKDTGKGMRILIQELEQALLLRFPENKKIEEQEEQKRQELNLQIAEILNQMEDLMEALDIGS